MAFKVFVDTNVILDIFLKREPFFDNSQKLVLEIPEKNVIPLISSSSVTDIYYICKKSGMEKDVILEKLKKVLKTFEVLIIDKESVNNAILSDIKDFEDAVQIMACKKEKIDLIITRNKKDFENEWIEVQTPEEYLSSISPEPLMDSADWDEHTE
ncbi:MAG: PIN domain-containing protein [Candidatus Aminicenantes bacterium]|jgi:predicted nucleic acid-binding protein